MADKMNYIYSIIIPHYNIPGLLVRCLKSIPVREDIQVIVVDDCSPNADTYKERFPEIFSRPNLEWYSTPIGGSAGRARNIGLEHASGKWVLFADADDYFTENLSSILEKHKKSTFDVIHFMAESVDCYTLEPSNRQIARNESINAFFRKEVNGREAALWYTVVWAQMISRKYIEENYIRFDEIVVANDMLFAAKIACYTENVSFSKEVIYVITTRENSLHDSKFKDPNKYLVYQQTILRFNRYVRSHGIYLNKPFMFKIIPYTYRTYGKKSALKALKMLIGEHALFYGLGDYIGRRLKL